MKQGLALRVSQHLALTPQLQQSIRLLQLSTLELGQEVQQMLDDNPFLEMNPEDGGEEFGPVQSDSTAREDVEADAGGDAGGELPAFTQEPVRVSDTADTIEAEPSGAVEEAPSWDG